MKKKCDESRRFTGAKQRGICRLLRKCPVPDHPSFCAFSSLLLSSFLGGDGEGWEKAATALSTLAQFFLSSQSLTFFWCNNPPKLTTFKHLPHVCVSACLFVFRVCVCVGLWCVHCWRREGGGKGRAKREKEGKESAQHPALFFVRVRHVTGAVRKKGCASAAAGVMRTAGSYASMRATASQKHA